MEDDDIAVGAPILFVIILIFGIGIYHEIQKAFADDAEPASVEVARDYAEQAEEDLRLAQEAREQAE